MDLLNTDTKRLEYAERIYNRDKNNIKKPINIQEKEIERFKIYLKERPEIFQEYLNKITFETYDNMLGIISFSFIWDNVLLWSHYADNHNGFCIGFNRDKLEDLFYCGGSVEYTNDFPLLDPIQADRKEFIKYQAYIKAKDWEYEKEYRLIRIIESDLESKSESERKIYILNDFFSEIILGYNFPATEENEVLKIAKIKKIPVYRAIKQKNSFLLKKIKLSPEF